MTAVLLGWNQQQWQWHDYAGWIEHIQRHGRRAGTWSVGRHVNIAKGSDAWLLLQGRRRGLIGHGVIRSEPYEDTHYLDPSRTTHYVRLEWISLVPIADRIPPSILESHASGVSWDHVYGSGRPVPSDAEASVHALWERFGPGAEQRDVGELPSGLFPEGAVRTITVNRYERDPQARQACIAHWGLSCVACGMDFAATYGPIGEGFIHVHHTTPISQLGPGYEIDPVAELRPLCANCHAMVHTQDPPMTPDDLATVIRSLPRRR